jgi:hypothetical protein
MGLMIVSTRNASGVKSASDCYRTIKGIEYRAWMSFPSKDRTAAYRDADVRCRRFGEELFVHILDEDMAAQIDAQMEDYSLDETTGSAE